MKTTAVRIHGVRDLRMDTFELPEIREDEILARIVTDSLCLSTYKVAQKGSALFPSLAAVCAVYALNKILGTNFMFLNNGGTGNPLAWAESVLGNPGYLLALPVLIGLVWLILYMPLLVARKRTAQNG